MNKNREEEIIREVLLGDTQAFEYLVHKYQRPVYNLMLRNTGEAEMAADLSQEAFVRAYQRLETFKMGNRFFPWLYSLSLNLARDWQRKKSRDRHVFVENAAVMVRDQDKVDTQAMLNNHMDGTKAFEVVMGLDQKYREALILRFRHDFSMKEIASTLGITISGAKMRVSRGLDMVRLQFQEVSDDR